MLGGVALSSAAKSEIGLLEAFFFCSFRHSTSNGDTLRHEMARGDSVLEAEDSVAIWSCQQGSSDAWRMPAEFFAALSPFVAIARFCLSGCTPGCIDAA